MGVRQRRDRQHVNGKPYPTLKAYRRSKGISQAQAARLVGISQASWWRIERGLEMPRLALAKKLARQTGVSLARLRGVKEATR